MTLGFLAGVSGGCLGIISNMSSGGPDEDDLAEYWYTHAGRDPFADRAQALVLGHVTLGGGGGEDGVTFGLERQEGDAWTRVSVTLEYRVSHDRGLIIGTTWDDEKHETTDIWAGNAPPERRAAVAPVYGQGHAVASLFMGDNDWIKNWQALQTWLPRGWFFLRLPPGTYRFVDLEFYKSAAESSSTLTTTTTTQRTWSRQVAVGDSFSAAAGVVSYLGSRRVDADGSSHMLHTPVAANEMLRQAVRRLPKHSPAWSIVDATTQPLLPGADRGP